MKEISSNAVINFMKSMRSYLINHYHEDYYIGNLYIGESTIIYFPFTPKELKEQKLKIAIVFNQAANRFEIWLAGQNKDVQKKYWEIFKGSDWNKYNVPAKITDGFSIVDHIMIANPDFNDTNSLRSEIESVSLKFIKDIEEVLIAK
jgi:hypothetical protein